MKLQTIYCEIEKIVRGIESPLSKLFISKETMWEDKATDSFRRMYDLIIEEEVGSKKRYYALTVEKDNLEKLLKLSKEKNIQLVNVDIDKYDYLVLSNTIDVEYQEYRGIPLTERIEAFEENIDGVIPLIEEMILTDAVIVHKGVEIPISHYRVSESTMSVYAKYVDKELGWRTHKMMWYQNEIKIQEYLTVRVRKDVEVDLTEMYSIKQEEVKEGYIDYNISTEELDIIPLTYAQVQKVYSYDYMLYVCRRIGISNSFKEGMELGLTVAESLVGRPNIDEIVTKSYETERATERYKNVKITYRDYHNTRASDLNNNTLKHLHSKNMDLTDYMNEVIGKGKLARSIKLGYTKGFNFSNGQINYPLIKEYRNQIGKRILNEQLGKYKIRISMLAYKYYLDMYQVNGSMRIHQSEEMEDIIEIRLEGLNDDDF